MKNIIKGNFVFLVTYIAGFIAATIIIVLLNFILTIKEQKIINIPEVIDLLLGSMVIFIYQAFILIFVIIILIINDYIFIEKYNMSINLTIKIGSIIISIMPIMWIVEDFSQLDIGRWIGFLIMLVLFLIAQLFKKKFYENNLF